MLSFEHLHLWCPVGLLAVLSADISSELLPTNGTEEALPFVQRKSNLKLLYLQKS